MFGINLEVAISLVQSEAGNRLRLDTGAKLPWERHLTEVSSLYRGEAPSKSPWGQPLARELSLDGGPITLGRTPSPKNQFESVSV